MFKMGPTRPNHHCVSNKVRFTFHPTPHWGEKICLDWEMGSFAAISGAFTDLRVWVEIGSYISIGKMLVSMT